MVHVFEPFVFIICNLGLVWRASSWFGLARQQLVEFLSFYGCQLGFMAFLPQAFSNRVSKVYCCLSLKYNRPTFLGGRGDGGPRRHTYNMWRLTAYDGN
jgi:hypothetical protein